jgi:hypothetical protein
MAFVLLTIMKGTSRPDEALAVADVSASMGGNTCGSASSSDVMRGLLDSGGPRLSEISQAWRFPRFVEWVVFESADSAVARASI